MMIPVIKEYLDVGVKNDDQLIKLAAVVQRFVSGIAAVNAEGGSLLTEDEKAQLLGEVKRSVKDLNQTSTVVSKQITNIESKADKLIELDDTETS